MAEHHLNYQGICTGPEIVLQFSKQDKGKGERILPSKAEEGDPKSEQAVMRDKLKEYLRSKLPFLSAGGLLLLQHIQLLH